MNQNTPPPKPVGPPPKEIDLSGKLFPVYDDGQPVLMRIPGSVKTYFPVFSEEEKLRKTMGEIKLDFHKIKLIQVGGEFFASIPLNITVIIDPWITDKKTTRYTEVFRPCPVEDES